jgi:cyanophycinase
MPDSLRSQFVELAGGKDARIVIIPTASVLAEQPQRLTSLTYFKSQNVKSVELLHTRDRKTADEPEFVKPLTEATGVWITGGDQSRISATYKGTAVEKELKKVLKRGRIIGGTSAGAAVMSSLMIVGGTVEAEIGTGLGLLPEVVIDQHFHNRNRLQRLLSVLAKHPECPGVGIDEETALIVRGRSATVRGNGNVRACLPGLGSLPPSIQVLKDGEKLDLDALIQTASTRIKRAVEARSPTPAPSTTPAAP